MYFPPTTLSVLAHMWNTGPSTAYRIAKEMGSLDQHTLCRCLKNLEANGIVTASQIKRGNTRRVIIYSMNKNGEDEVVLVMNGLHFHIHPDNYHQAEVVGIGNTPEEAIKKAVKKARKR